MVSYGRTNTPIEPQAAVPRVLVVGDIGLRLEMDFIPFGIECTLAATAAEGGAYLQSSRFAIAVVPPGLPDMSGVDFAAAVLHHVSDTVVFVWGNEVDANAMGQLARSGRVVHFPSHAEGSDIARYITGAQAAPAAVLPGGHDPPAHRRSSSFDLDGPDMVETPTESNDALTEQVARLQQDLRAALQKQADAQRDLARAKAESTSLRTSLAAKDDIHNQLTQQLAEAEMLAANERQQRESLTERLAEAEEAANVPELVAVADDRNMQGEIDEALDARDRARAEIETIRVELEFAQAEIAAERARAKGALDERDALRAELERARAQFADERAMADARAAETAMEFEQEMGHSRQQLDTVRHERDEVRNRFAEQKSEVEAMRGKLIAMSGELDGARARIANDMEEIESLRATAAEAMRMKAALDDTLDHVSTLQNEAQHHAVNVQQSSTAWEDRVNDLSSELARMEHAYAEAMTALEHERSMPREDIEPIQFELEEMRGSYDQERAARTTMESRLSALLAERDTLAKRMQNQLAETEKMQHEIRALRDSAEMSSMRHAAERADLGRDRVSAQQIRALEAKILEREARATALEREVAERRTEVAQIREKQWAADAAANRARQEIAERVSERTKEVAGLVRALEPFAWGLQRAVDYMQSNPQPGNTEHLKSLQLLSKTLEKLSSYVTRTDLLAEGISVDMEA